MVSKYPQETLRDTLKHKLKRLARDLHSSSKLISLMANPPLELGLRVHENSRKNLRKRLIYTYDLGFQYPKECIRRGRLYLGMCCEAGHQGAA